MKNTRVDPEKNELNLAPIMNLVIILIPMLLLSVVFEQMGVINISAPRLVTDDTGPPKDNTEVTIGISPSGYTIAAAGVLVPPIDRCTDKGSAATICVSSSEQVSGDLDQVRELRRRFDRTGDRGALEASNSKLAGVVEHYDRRALYNALVDLKQKFPSQTVVRVSADPDIPFELVVATMDVARYKLTGGDASGHFGGEPAFRQAGYQTSAGKPVGLFDDVVLAIMQ